MHAEETPPTAIRAPAGLRDHTSANPGFCCPPDAREVRAEVDRSRSRCVERSTSNSNELGTHPGQPGARRAAAEAASRATTVGVDAGSGGLVARRAPGTRKDNDRTRDVEIGR